MSNPQGSAIALNDANGIFANGPAIQVAIWLKSALVGNLTITGMTTSGGGPQAWVIAGGSAGYQAPPGSGHGGSGNVSFSYANASDYGKALATIFY